ncbi:NAD(P)H-dependent oxidoreductase [Luteimonas sp. RD2P54]|uniref:FMN dependent NADH:quinone oxidoreductase n=1 Tax=Luteimonas endophytica TaxID=3042023 RepID=A0ABT6J3U6_9GAMM|nr:NAD(P)H-dependent oxidoreductase [Luteimonas endophytica]MDH5821496.1 NAD(P)H-dependent oxidoreductase [Luteimonas endophytica]
MKLLHIDSSVTGPGSVTRALTAAIVAPWHQCPEATQVVYRDLNATPVAHLGGRPDPERDAEGARLLQEFLDADVVVIGAPMYNFAIPSTLKAWIDRVAVAGRTFRYTAHGPEGLAGDKRVIVAIGSGGLHAGRPEDFVEPYLRQVFGFLGVSDLEVVRAEGVALSERHRETALAEALRRVPPPRALRAAA